MEFKKLEVRSDDKDLERKKNLRKTLIAIAIGMLAGFSYYYFTHAQRLDVIPMGEAFKSTFVGGFIGFFVTNSPCARGKC